LRLSILFLPGLLMGLTLAGCDRQNAAAPQGEAQNAAAPTNTASGERYPTGILDRSHAGTPAPTQAFTDPDGQPAHFADFRGRPLLVNLWATWCGPCVIELPSLDALAGESQGDGLKVIAVSQDTGSHAEVAAFLTRHDVRNLQPYQDAEMQAMTTLHLDTLPTTILYDADGKEVWRMTGRAEWGSERVANLLREADQH
jgi:thiol-disulfide isomerase/thioredoxin